VLAESLVLWARIHYAVVIMRILLWYCTRFDWVPTIKTLENAPAAAAAMNENAIVAFIHVEPDDSAPGSSAETKLVKNTKWLARKWDTKQIILHSFTHLGEHKAEPEQAKALIDSVERRLVCAGYTAGQTSYGYFNDLVIKAPGHALARIYKEF
jgi:hypothetical protein